MYRYRIGGRKTPRDESLEPTTDVSLDDARGKTHGRRNLLSDGIDPINARKRSRR